MPALQRRVFCLGLFDPSETWKNGEADKTPIAKVAKEHGASEQTIYAWRKRFGANRNRPTSQQRRTRLAAVSILRTRSLRFGLGRA